jgi:glucan phosphorylase
MPSALERSSSRARTPVADLAGKTQDVRVSLDPAAIAQALQDNLYYVQGRLPQYASTNDWYMALAYTVRDRLLERWMRTMKQLTRDVRTVCYLSAEFLLGPHLGNTIVSLGIGDEVRQACQQVGQDLDRLLDQEEEPGLGNGGLGRLAAPTRDGHTRGTGTSGLRRVPRWLGGAPLTRLRRVLDRHKCFC